ncbi:hypothetical protein [Pseudoxanthomonas winnipegensis]|uniref:hypothetical protein n=1 Tax=Pseudoxanthomonas winnipegensis TaxID=2480810 RepID=UPI001038768A|nr:hypothetical protein [Pseudoxanthomonas winnipegensis]TBV75428.1 hypothetical protein EYC45_06240 [Pseudoxanthomonas winnipegensis]
MPKLGELSNVMEAADEFHEGALCGEAEHQQLGSGLMAALWLEINDWPQKCQGSESDEGI